MFLKSLLIHYLNFGLVLDSRIYRALGVFVIYCYRLLFRRLLCRQCQFNPSCSEFMLNQLRKTVHFEQLHETLTNRIDDCSEPLTWNYSSSAGLVANAKSERVYREHQLSSNFLDEIYSKIGMPK